MRKSKEIYHRWTDFDVNFLKTNYRTGVRGECTRLYWLMKREYTEEELRNVTPRTIRNKLKEMSKRGLVEL